MGSVGTGSNPLDKDGHMTESTFIQEANRQGKDGQDMLYKLDEYVTSSYGKHNLANEITDLIENIPTDLLYKGDTLYRGLMFNSESELNNFLNSHRLGDILVTRPDGMSWTSELDIATEFSSYASPYSVILVNDDKYRRAIGIQNVADSMMASKEVLFSNKWDFVVNKVEKKDGVVYMYVKSTRSRR